MNSLPDLVWNNYLAVVCILVALAMGIWMLLKPPVTKQSKKPITQKTVNVNLDFSDMNTENIDTVMKYVKDMSSAQIEMLFGGRYDGESKEATQKTSAKAKTENKESGETGDN